MEILHAKYFYGEACTKAGVLFFVSGYHRSLRRSECGAQSLWFGKARVTSCNSQLVYVQLATHVLLMHHSFGMNDSYEILLADSKLEGITD